MRKILIVAVLGLALTACEKEKTDAVVAPVADATSSQDSVAPSEDVTPSVDVTPITSSADATVTD